MVSETQYSDFLDLAYGAVVEPEAWVAVIERFADLMGGAKAWMPSLNMQDGGGEGVIARIDPAAQSAYFEYYALKNPFFEPGGRALASPWPLTILTDEDMMPKDELVRTEYYNDFLRPQGIHSAAIVRLCRQGDLQTTLNITRPHHRGQFTKADRAIGGVLQPHLIRALKLSRALAVDRPFADDLAEVLDRSRHGLFLVDAAGRLQHVNREGERLLGEVGGLSTSAGRLSASAPAAALRLEALIGRAACSDGSGRVGGSMALATPERSTPLSLTVAPLRSARLSFPFRPCVLVCVTDLEADMAPPEQLLRDLFGLTRAEARVALGVFEGSSPRQIAGDLGVAFATVRNQLARVFEKTNTHSQADLVRLMMRAVGAELITDGWPG